MNLNDVDISPIIILEEAEALHSLEQVHQLQVMLTQSLVQAIAVLRKVVIQIMVLILIMLSN